LAPDELNIEKAEDILIQAAKGPTVLGADPATSLPVY
jgi:topoisomerase IA-like protein